MLEVWPTWFFYIIAGLIGAIMGSFANVCIVRMPCDRSVVWPRSNCPKCRHSLAIWENVPIVSYIILRGRCSHCGRGISALYPIVELLCIGLSLFAWWYFQDPFRYLAYFCLLVVPLVIITFIDIFHLIIPDIISIPGIFVGIGVHVLFESHGFYLHAFIDSLIGAIGGGALLFIVAYVYEKLKKQEGLGGGDIKLIAMLGAFFGWKASLFILLMSSIMGSVVGLFLILVLRKDKKYPIPYGPFLALAGLLNLFFGERFVSWYMHLFM